MFSGSLIWEKLCCRNLSLKLEYSVLRLFMINGASYRNDILSLKSLCEFNKKTSQTDKGAYRFWLGLNGHKIWISVIIATCIKTISVEHGESLCMLLHCVSGGEGLELWNGGGVLGLEGRGGIASLGERERGVGLMRWPEGRMSLALLLSGKN